MNALSSLEPTSPSTGRAAAAWMLGPLAFCLGCGQAANNAGGGLPQAGAAGDHASSGGSHAGGTHASGGSSSGSGGTSASGGSSATATTYVYVGSGYWGDPSGKINVFKTDVATGELTPVDEVTVGTLNSFAALNPTGTRLYVGDESENKLRSYAIARSTGELTPIHEQSLAGGPVFVSVDAADKFVLTAYYGAGSSQVVSVQSNGQFGGSVDTETSGAESHAIVFDPSGKFVFVPSKGENKISQYLFDSSTGMLEPNEVASVGRAGGPRHLDFHPTAAFAYGVNELGNTITTYSFDPTQGRLTEVESLDMLPPGFTGQSTAADVHVAPDGRHVYATNRAANEDGTVAIFSIDEMTGKLTLVGHESTRGRPPRNFAIHPSGVLMLVANHDTSNIAAFQVSASNGSLTHLKTHAVSVKPFWVGFLVVPD